MNLWNLLLRNWDHLNMVELKEVMNCDGITLAISFIYYEARSLT